MIAWIILIFSALFISLGLGYLVWILGKQKQDQDYPVIDITRLSQDEPHRRTIYG